MKDTMPAQLGPSPWDQTERVAVLAICATAFVVCLMSADTMSIWWDEVFSVRLAVEPMSEWLRAMRGGEVNGFLHHAVLRLLVPVADDNLTVLRLPSIAMWTIGIPFAYAIARRILPARVALVATGLCALAPFGLRAAMEAQMYSYAATMALAATVMFVRFVERPTKVRALGYGAVMGAGLYAHYYLAFVVCAHLVSLVIHPRRRDLSLAAMPAAVLIAIAAAPLALVSHRSGGVQINWVEPASPHDLYDFWTRWVGVRDRPSAWWGHLLFVPTTILVLTGALASVTRGGATADDPSRSHETWCRRVVALLVIVPIAGGIVGSWWLRPMLVDRYLVIIVWPAILLALIGAVSLHAWLARGRVAVPIALASLMIVSMGIGLWSVLREEHRDDWRGAVAMLHHEFEAGDVIVAGDWGGGGQVQRALTFHMDDPPIEAQIVRIGALERGNPEAVALIDPTPERLWIVTRGGLERESARLLEEIGGQWEIEFEWGDTSARLRRYVNTS